MSSLRSEELDSMISPSSSIPALISRIRYSYRQDDFEDVQNILVGREQNMKFEVENLEKGRESMKEEIRSLEKRYGLAELEKIKLDERLKKSDRECEELKEIIKRLSEYQDLGKEREKRAEEQYVKLREEHFKMMTEKNRTIFELMEEMNASKEKNYENVKLVDAYQEGFDIYRARIMEMEKEIDRLKREKIKANRESDNFEEKFNTLQMEIDQNMEELNDWRMKKLESDKAAEENKNKFESLLAKMTKVQEAVADVFQMNEVGNIDELADDIKIYAAVHAWDNGTPSHDENQFSGDGSMQSVGNTHCVGGAYDHADENAFVASPRVVGSNSNLPKGDQCSGFSGKAHARNAFVTSPRVVAEGSTCNLAEVGCNGSSDEAHAGNVSSRVVGSSSDLPEGGCNESSQKGHQSCSLGSHDDTLQFSNQLILEATSSDRERKNSYIEVAPNVIEIIDSDDEGHADASDDSLSDEPANDNDKNVTSFQCSFSIRPIKQEIMNDIEDLSTSSNPKRKRSSYDISEDENRPNGRPKEIRVLETTHYTNGDSSDSEDDACSDSDLDRLVASLKHPEMCRKWVLKADLLKALEEDDELCMDAICTLYRQQYFPPGFKERLNLCKINGINFVDALRGLYLAMYLIDDDPDLKVRKTITQVRQFNPDVLSQCKRLATRYHEKLFKIYCSKKDPFFGRGTL